MLCGSPQAVGEGSTLAETKKPTKDGPVKAYDMPRQIEETAGNQSLRKKGCECEESAS